MSVHYEFIHRVGVLRGHASCLHYEVIHRVGAL